jgi:putative tryptophan/tyrosine transport system substrate-binding protein
MRSELFLVDISLLLGDFRGLDFECFERAVALADRILKGAKPGELPFEQPTQYKFAINVKVAKALQLEVPQSVMASADIVIE